MPLLRQTSLLRKIPRIVRSGVAWVCGALLRKKKTQFKVVGLEEVFRTAVEVDGTLILENLTELRQWKPQLQPHDDSVKGLELATAETRVAMARKTIILCIDDNSTSLDIRRMLLEAKGFDVRTATDGLTGLEITNNEPIDAVILDYKMPSMNGEEVAKRLRATHPQIPILLLSGCPGLLPESLLSIVDSFVEKGRPAALLIAEVERLTGGRRNPEADRRRA